MEKINANYEVLTEFSEKQMEYYRQRKPWKTVFRCLAYFCYILGGAMMAMTMILFITAQKGEFSIWYIAVFLIGGFLLVDGAMGNRWIDRIYEKNLQKKQIDGVVKVSFEDKEIVLQYEKYKRTETFSYKELKTADNDFEGYYLKFADRLLYLKRKQFQTGDAWEFPDYLNERTEFHLNKER